MALRGIATLALALAAVGCGSDSSGPGLTGEFSGNVTGDHTKSMDGDAFFSLGPVFGEQDAGFSLLLLEGSALGENDDFIIISRAQAGRPSAGTYQIADQDAGAPAASEFIASWFPATGETVDGNFFSTGGTVTITTSSSQRVRGTFEFDAIGTFENDPEAFLDVTVTGEFDAARFGENAQVSRVTNLTVRRAATR